MCYVRCPSSCSYPTLTPSFRAAFTRVPLTFISHPTRTHAWRGEVSRVVTVFLKTRFCNTDLLIFPRPRANSSPAGALTARRAWARQCAAVAHTLPFSRAYLCLPSRTPGFALSFLHASRSRASHTHAWHGEVTTYCPYFSSRNTYNVSRRNTDFPIR